MKVKNKILSVFLVVGISFIGGCQSDMFDGGVSKLGFIPAQKDHATLSLVEYKSWYEDSKLKFQKSKKIGNREFVLKYVPNEVYVGRVLDNFGANGGIQLDSVRKNYDGEVNFILTIQANMELGNDEVQKSMSYSDYDHLVNYYSFSFQKDVIAVQGKDTIPCDMCHYERTYEANSNSVFNIAFNADRINMERPYTIIVEDKVYGCGVLKFLFSPETFQNLPIISLR